MKPVEERHATWDAAADAYRRAKKDGYTVGPIRRRAVTGHYVFTKEAEK